MERKCYFCGRKLTSYKKECEGGVICQCPECGSYWLMDCFNSDLYDCCNDNFDNDKMGNKEILVKFCNYMFYNKLDDKLFYISSDDEYEKYLDNNKNGLSKFISLSVVESWYPKTFSEKIDKIILEINRRSKYLGDEVSFTYEQILNLFFITGYYYLDGNIVVNDTLGKQIAYIMNYLKNNDLIECKTEYNILLMPKGLARVDDLQKHQSNNKKAFVAMKFGDDTKDLREKIRDGIEKLAGYEMFIIDEHHHNNQIVPELLHDIKISKFVVAELSHHNNGAYYEAGYATGLGKEVIILCNKEAIKNKELHFDVAQKNAVIYNKIEDIPKLLADRIIATINKN